MHEAITGQTGGSVGSTLTLQRSTSPPRPGSSRWTGTHDGPASAEWQQDLWQVSRASRGLPSRCVWRTGPPGGPRTRDSAIIHSHGSGRIPVSQPACVTVRHTLFQPAIHLQHNFPRKYRLMCPAAPYTSAVSTLRCWHRRKTQQACTTQPGSPQD